MELNTQPAAPAADAESAAWAQLAKDVGDAGDAQIEAPASEQPEAQAVEKTEAEPETTENGKKLPPEEIEKRYRQLQGALKEEREGRKKASERTDNLEKLLSQLVEQRKATAAPAQPVELPTAPQVPQIPSLEEDPIGHFQAKLAEQQRVIDELRGTATKTQQQLAKEAEDRQFWANVNAQEAQFRKAAPDYEDAMTHLATSRMAEYQAIYPDDSPQAVQFAAENGFKSVADLRVALLNQDGLAIAQQAMRMGRNPSQVYYDLAKQRGYTGKAAAKAAQPEQPQSALAIAAAKAGQRATNAMQSGNVRSDSMTLEDIADLYLTDPDRADKEFKRLNIQ